MIINPNKTQKGKFDIAELLFDKKIVSKDIKTKEQFSKILETIKKNEHKTTGYIEENKIKTSDEFQDKGNLIKKNTKNINQIPSNEVIKNKGKTEAKEHNKDVSNSETKIKKEKLKPLEESTKVELTKIKETKTDFHAEKLKLVKKVEVKETELLKDKAKRKTNDEKKIDLKEEIYNIFQLRSANSDNLKQNKDMKVKNTTTEISLKKEKKHDEVKKNIESIKGLETEKKIEIFRNVLRKYKEFEEKPTLNVKNKMPIEYKNIEKNENKMNIQMNIQMNNEGIKTEDLKEMLRTKIMEKTKRTEMNKINGKNEEKTKEKVKEKNYEHAEMRFSMENTTVKQINIGNTKEMKNEIKIELDKLEEFKFIDQNNMVLKLKHDELGDLEIKMRKTTEGLQIKVSAKEGTKTEEITAMLEEIKGELKDKGYEMTFEVEYKEKEEKEKREEEYTYMKNEEKEEADEDKFQQTLSQVLGG